MFVSVAVSALTLPYVVPCVRITPANKDTSVFPACSVRVLENCWGCLVYWTLMGAEGNASDVHTHALHRVFTMSGEQATEHLLAWKVQSRGRLISNLSYLLVSEGQTLTTLLITEVGHVCCLFSTVEFNQTCLIHKAQHWKQIMTIFQKGQSPNRVLSVCWFDLF